MRSGQAVTSTCQQALAPCPCDRGQLSPCCGPRAALQVRSLYRPLLVNAASHRCCTCAAKRRTRQPHLDAASPSARHGARRAGGQPVWAPVHAHQPAEREWGPCATLGPRARPSCACSCLPPRAADSLRLLQLWSRPAAAPQARSARAAAVPGRYRRRCPPSQGTRAPPCCCVQAGLCIAILVIVNQVGCG